jgi:hypothetical protein
VRKAYAGFGAGLVVLGLVHMLTTFRLFDELTGSAIWFFSGGIAMVLLGFLNLLNREYGRHARGMRVISVGANVLMTAFAAVAGVATQATLAEFVVVVGLVAGTTFLSATAAALR